MTPSAQSTADLTKAIELNAEMIHHTAQLQAQLLEQSRRFASRGRYADSAREAATWSKAVEPLIALVLAEAEKTIKLVDLALAYEEVVRLGDPCWQLALVSLEQERRMVEDVCRGRLRETMRRHRALRPAWRREWDLRSEEILDVIDDRAETIALGLNAETRQAIEERIQEAARATVM